MSAKKITQAPVFRKMPFGVEPVIYREIKNQKLCLVTRYEKARLKPIELKPIELKPIILSRPIILNNQHYSVNNNVFLNIFLSQPANVGSILAILISPIIFGIKFYKKFL